MRGDTPLSLRIVLPTVSVGPSGSASCSAPRRTAACQGLTVNLDSAQRVDTWS